MNNVGICGFGEVGSSLNEVYISADIIPSINDPFKNIHDEMKNVNILNICFPCNEFSSFIYSARSIIDKTSANLVIIHSSIVLGIVEELSKIYKDKHIVHSPIRGVHPNLAKSTKTFVKYIGIASENHRESGVAAQNHFLELGIKSKITTARTSVLMKLLSTTYYGMCIAFTEDMGKLCEQENIDFEMIRDWTRTYNSGYHQLGVHNVQRPDLFRIPDRKIIGGHCVIPNAVLLKNMFPNSEAVKAFDYILRYSDQKNK